MASRKAELYGDFMKLIASDIYILADAIGFQPSWQQKQGMDAIMRGDRKIAIKSGQGPGKTIFSSVAGLFRLLQNENHKLLLVAPTMHQAKSVWLAQVRKLVNSQKAHPIFRKIFDCTATEVRVMGRPASDWGAMLNTASTTSEKAQGQHAENMDVFFEEASGISAELVEQYEGTMTNPNALFLQIGNPNQRTSPFFNCFHRDKHKWSCYTWNAEETPASKWFNPERNVELADKYGRTSDVYRVRVLGEFPHSDPDAIMSHEDLEGCFDRKRMIELSGTYNLFDILPMQFGLDLARFGGDENVVFQRQGYAVRNWEFWPHKDPNEVVLETFQWQRKSGWSDQECLYTVDASGIGQGVLYRFEENRKNFYEFHNHSSAYMGGEYDNQITEALFHVRDLAREKKLYIPEDPVLIEQLTSRVYHFTKKNLIVAESKDEYKKRTGLESPDRAEALSYCFYDYATTPAMVSRGS